MRVKGEGTGYRVHRIRHEMPARLGHRVQGPAQGRVLSTGPMGLCASGTGYRVHGTAACVCTYLGTSRRDDQMVGLCICIYTCICTCIYLRTSRRDDQMVTLEPLAVRQPHLSHAYTHGANCMLCACCVACCGVCCGACCVACCVASVYGCMHVHMCACAHAHIRMRMCTRTV